jgi:molecular chaperone HscB
MMSFDFQQNHFQLFGLAQTFVLDMAALDQQFRTLQTQVHPDKSAHLSDAEQRLAMQQSTRVNEAYQTLRNPLKRARYLLSLQGVDTQEETNTAMPVDFLMAQMERREAVADAQQARDMDKLDALQDDMRKQTRALEQQLAGRIDTEKNYAAAAELVRKLRFMEKLAEEIHAAYDAIDS